MPRRSGKGEGERAYASYLKRLASATTTHSAPVTVCHFVFVATCSGSDRFGREIGLPLACIGVSPDPSTAVRKMREARHGALTPSCRDPFKCEPGWDDWSLVQLIPEMAGGVRLADGVRLLDGVLALSGDRRVPRAEVRLALSDALRHLRVHDVACTGEAVRARHIAGGPPLVAPRYTPIRAYGTATGRRVEDLYACDVWRNLSGLAVTVEAAALRARARFLPDP